MIEAVKTCSGCNKVIGEIIKGGNGVTSLKISGQEFTFDLIGRSIITCHRCGTVNEWLLDGYRMDHLIGRIRKVLRDV